jgi:hypothetical protein
LTAISAMRHSIVMSSIFTLNDFKLRKEGGLIVDRLGIKART